jgi:undecaprenyl-phosphate 4-deoxy-4-formamido-L-arabinose transferase
MKKLSFVIPCYCSEKSVGGVIDEIITTVTNDGRYDYEIICINDFSKDNTLSVLKTLAQENKKIKVLSFSRNFGQHSALMAGFNHVSGDIVVCLDDDGQNPPSEMFKLIDKLEEGYDLVSAKYKEKKRSLFRRFGTKVSFWMSSTFVGKPKDIDLNSYYVFQSYILRELVKYKNAYPFVHGLILRITRNMANVEIEHKSREFGASGYSFRKLLSLWVNGFTAFSEKPLRVASIFGVLCALGGFGFGIYTIINKIINPSIPLGYSSIMTAVMILSGAIMLFLGLLGEYIGRIYISINNAPQFVVKEAINFDQEEVE